MVGASDTELTQAILNRKPGQTVVYGNNSDGSHWITITGSAANYASHRDPFPWERRLATLQALVADTIRLFGRFNTGWIPSKGHPGLLVDHVPTDHIAHPTSPLDLRRLIQQLYTPRRLCAP